MKKLSFPEKPVYGRFYFWICLVLAVFAAHYIVAYGAAPRYTVGRLFRMAGYYLALVVSIGIAFPVILFAAYAAEVLSMNYPWKANRLKRFWLQFFWIFLIPLSAILTMVLAYFELRGQNIHTWGYFSRELLLIVGFLFMLNVILSAVFRDVEEADRSGVPPVPAGISADVPSVADEQCRHVAYYKSMDDITYAYDFDNRPEVVPQSLAELDRSLPPERFFRIRRECIVNIGMIAGWVPGTSKTGKLIVKEGFPPDDFSVSQRSLGAFRQWYDRNKQANG